MGGCGWGKVEDESVGEDLWNYKAKALEGSRLCILKLPKTMTGIVLERQ